MRRDDSRPGRYDWRWPFGHPPQAPAIAAVHGVGEGGVLVREEDATALVADVLMLRAARGHDVTVTPENTVWLVRGAVVMLGAFGPAAEDENQ